MFETDACVSVEFVCFFELLLMLTGQCRVSGVCAS